MMLVRAHFKHNQKQTGSTLIMGLIILILVMLLGVTAMKVSDTQFQLAGNLQFEDLAMNNAEAAIDAGERWLAGTTGSAKNYLNAGFTTAATVNYTSAGGNAMTTVLYPISSTPDPFAESTWSGLQVEANSNQAYLIQLVSRNSTLIGSNQVTGGRASSGCSKVNTYRITAKGVSARGATKFVQSFYSVLSC
jgi:Tfp pilus assembly protein PilX